MPAIVEDYINKINKITGREYGLFNYYGAKDAERVIIAMGSVTEAIRETIDHRRVTGPAIVQNIAREGRSAVDAIVIGVGSGGTVTGVGETIKAWTNDVRIAAVEPYESQALGGGLTGPHGISDLGYGFVPENFNAYVVDNVVAVNTTDAQRAAQKVLRTDAIPASVASGAVLQAAAQLINVGASRAALAILPGRQFINTL